MRITLVDGRNEDPLLNLFQKEVEALLRSLEREYQVDYFPIKDMNFAYCQGCWDCWTKTPGQCRLKDDGEGFIKSLAHSEKLIFLSPVVAGFISAETKKALDRFIPNALPYIELYEKECHHLPRYPINKKLGIYLLDDGHIDPEAEEIIFENFERVKLNNRADLLLKGRLSRENHEEVCYEICHC